MLDEKIHTLSELSDEIAGVIADLDASYWVDAEVASLQDRGHCYIDLVEKGEFGELAAKARATCWQSTWRALRAKFIDATGQLPQAGMKIRAEVSVEYHPVYGLSLNIHDIDPVCTLGELARRRQETILRLDAEDLLMLQKGLVLPTLVRRIAVISSDTAAGYQDFVHQLSEPGYRISTMLFPATMQGERAEESILQALHAIEMQQEDFDAVVIIRGGGATTDLGCFDSYELCRACALFPLPILTGIGHTRDISVLDMVANLPLKTPTAVADWLLSRMAAQEQRILELRHRLTMTARLIIERRLSRLNILRERIRGYNPERIYRQGYSLLTANGHIVRSVADVQAGQLLTTHLVDGEVNSVAQ